MGFDAYNWTWGIIFDTKVEEEYHFVFSRLARKATSSWIDFGNSALNFILFVSDTFYLPFVAKVNVSSTAIGIR